MLPNVAELLRELKPDDAVDSMSRFYEDSGLLLSRLEFLKTLARSYNTSGEQVTSPGPVIVASMLLAAPRAWRLYFRNAACQGFTRLAGKLPSPLGCQANWLVPLGRQHQRLDGAEYRPGDGPGGNRRPADRCIDNLAFKHTQIGVLFRKGTAPRMAQRSVRPGRHHIGKVQNEQLRLYVQHCAKCHDRQEGGQKSHEGAITYDLQELGTDPLRAQNFATPLEKEKPFTDGLQAVAAKVKKHAIAANPGEHPDELDLPDHKIRWLTTRGYVARPLEGVWASPPYLHNGSVPTLDDLLKPENERPVCFPVGHREYDPVKLGYVSDFNKVPVAERSRFFVYDTRIKGNSNKGHLYGTCLSASEREALLEYLKVMNPRDVIAPVRPGAQRALGMEDVAANEDADIRELKDLQIEQMKIEADALGGRELPTDRGQHPKLSWVPACEVHGPCEPPGGAAGRPFP